MNSEQISNGISISDINYISVARDATVVRLAANQFHVALLTPGISPRISLIGLTGKGLDQVN